MEAGAVFTHTGIDTGIDIFGEGFRQMLEDGVGQQLVVAPFILVLQNSPPQILITFPIFVQNIPKLRQGQLLIPKYIFVNT